MVIVSCFRLLSEFVFPNRNGHYWHTAGYVSVSFRSLYFQILKKLEEVIALFGVSVSFRSLYFQMGNDVMIRGMYNSFRLLSEFVFPNPIPTHKRR